MGENMSFTVLELEELREFDRQIDAKKYIKLTPLEKEFIEENEIIALYQSQNKFNNYGEYRSYYFKRKELTSKYYESNKERILKKGKEYREKNKEHIKKLKRQWYLKHRAEILENKKNKNRESATNVQQI